MTTFVYLENRWILFQTTFYFNQNKKADDIPPLYAGYFWGYALQFIERDLKNHPFSSFSPLVAPIASNIYTAVVSKLHLTLSVWRIYILRYILRTAEDAIKNINSPKYCSKIHFWQLSIAFKDSSVGEIKYIDLLKLVYKFRLVY